MIEVNVKTLEVLIDEDEVLDLAVAILKAKENAKKAPASAPWSSFSKAVAITGLAGGVTTKSGVVTLSVMRAPEK